MNLPSKYMWVVKKKYVKNAWWMYWYHKAVISLENTQIHRYAYDSVELIFLHTQKNSKENHLNIFYQRICSVKS
jgi:hypothetical protein